MNISDSEKKLLANISKGDSYSFRIFYDKYFKQVLQFSHCFIKSNEVCEEIVSDVFISIWLNKEKLSEIENIEAYLFIITRNKSLNYLEKETPLIEPDRMGIPEPEIEYSNPEKQLIFKEFENAVQHSIYQLPERCRIIFQLSRDHKLKHQQIAKILSISENTVHAQITIAINKLHTLLKKYIYTLL